MRRLIVGDLCGGSQNSVFNALKYLKGYEVGTFDANPKTAHDKQVVYVPSRVRANAILGGNLARNVGAIIEKFNPKFGYIENPRTSLIWSMGFFPSGYKNIAEYSSYDLNMTLKPTIFLSNVELDLKRYHITGNVKRHKNDRCVGSSNNETGTRVKIPGLLIIDIFKQGERKG